MEAYHDDIDPLNILWGWIVGKSQYDSLYHRAETRNAAGGGWVSKCKKMEERRTTSPNERSGGCSRLSDYITESLSLGWPPGLSGVRQGAGGPVGHRSIPLTHTLSLD